MPVYGLYARIRVGNVCMYVCVWIVCKIRSFKITGVTRRHDTSPVTTSTRVSPKGVLWPPLLLQYSDTDDSLTPCDF